MHPPSGVLFRLYDADRLLERAIRRGARRFVTAWVRGLGDVAYILAEFVRHVRERVPGAEVSILVRPGLEEACHWIEGLSEVIVVPEWSRARTADSIWKLAFPPPWEVHRALARRGLGEAFDAVLPYPLGPWYERTLAQRRPRLAWSEQERRFGHTFINQTFGECPRFVIALNTHIGTSRYYDFDKEWGLSNFAVLMGGLLEAIPESRLVLVDAAKVDGLPTGPRVLDARGILGVSGSISVMAASDLVIGLDAAAANLLYFLAGVSLDLVVLLGRTACFTPLVCPPASPTMRLTTLRGADEDIRAITPAMVLETVRTLHAQGRSAH